MAGDEWRIRSSGVMNAREYQFNFHTLHTNFSYQEIGLENPLSSSQVNRIAIDGFIQRLRGNDIERDWIFPKSSYEIFTTATFNNGTNPVGTLENVDTGVSLSSFGILFNSGQPPSWVSYGLTSNGLITPEYLADDYVLIGFVLIQNTDNQFYKLGISFFKNSGSFKPANTELRLYITGLHIR